MIGVHFGADAFKIVPRVFESLDVVGRDFAQPVLFDNVHGRRRDIQKIFRCRTFREHLCEIEDQIVEQHGKCRKCFVLFFVHVHVHVLFIVLKLYVFVNNNLAALYFYTIKKTMNILEKIYSGDSWFILISLLVLSVLVCVFLGLTKNMVADWGYEPIVPIPQQYQQSPLVQKWFDFTRGSNYEVRLEKGETLSKYNTHQTEKRKARTDFLVSGYAFSHFLLHFCIAFFCPKLVPMASMIGIGWEILESYWHMHCALDIVWNLCGSLCGLFIRTCVFPQ